MVIALDTAIKYEYLIDVMPLEADETALNGFSLEFCPVYTGKLSLLVYTASSDPFNKRPVGFPETYGLIRYSVNISKHYIIYKNSYRDKLSNKNTRQAII